MVLMASLTTAMMVVVVVIVLEVVKARVVREEVMW